MTIGIPYYKLAFSYISFIYRLQKESICERKIGLVTTIHNPRVKHDIVK